MTVTVNMADAGKLLRKRGLEPNGKVQKKFTTECAQHMDKYVPFRQGLLRNTRFIGDDFVLYQGPYARNMYYGVVMVDPQTGAAGFLTAKGWRSRVGVRKILSGREYKYNHAPQRGKLWDKRMWAEKKDVIIASVAKLAGGKPG